MCGRYVLTGPQKALDRLFALAPLPGTGPRYNIAPGQVVPIVRILPDPGRGGGGVRACVPAIWGLVSRGPKSPPGGAAAGSTRTINARSETAATRPMFRESLRLRRCLLPADGFYEWQGPRGRPRQPWLFRVGDGQPFAFAGLWDPSPRPDGSEADAVAILTTAANGLVAPVHDRMPLILPPGAHATWLDPSVDDPADLAPLMVPFPAAEMTAVTVGSHVNSVANDDARCVEPVRPPPGLFDSI